MGTKVVLHAGLHLPLLAVSAVTALGAMALTWVVAIQPFLPVDATIEREVQSVNVGPLSGLFTLYTSIGGPSGVVGMILVSAAVLLINRPAWRLLVAAALASGWYFLLSNLIIRPRPSVPDVLRVTEHPGASSYPSGHMILFIFYAAVLMLCVGYKLLPHSWRPFGWAFAALLVIMGGVSRMYSGAHWPSDVLAGALIGVSWMSLVVAVRWISDPVVGRPSHVPDSRQPAAAPPMPA